jgi:hypothetical protein
VRIAYAARAGCTTWSIVTEMRGRGGLMISVGAFVTFIGI